MSQVLRRPLSGRAPSDNAHVPGELSASKVRRGGMKLAHAAWIVAAFLALGVLLASLSGYSIWLRGESPITPGPDRVSGFYVLSGLTSLASALLCLSMAFLLFRQKRHDAMALYVSFYVLAYGIVMSGPLENLSPLFPGVIDLATAWIQPVLLAAPTVWLILLLPDGRLVPAWSRWVGLLSIASLVILPFLDARSVATANTLPAQIMYGIWIALYLLAFAAQVYRYRRVSTPTQRVQTRWIVFGLVVWICLIAVQSVPYVYLANLPPGAPLPDWAAASAALWWVLTAIIPATLSISILRHRLYDIDLIIHRTLVYGALTAILAGLYSGSISLFQKLFVAVTGEKSDAAIVITTLILASTFTPIKTRLQAIVDRRFRDTHDPLRRLAEFSVQVDSGIWVVDRRLALTRLLEEAMSALDATAGQVSWVEGGAEREVVTRGVWNSDTRLTVTLAHDGRLQGRISLGPRRNPAAYGPEDAQALTAAAEAVARVLSLSSKPRLTAAHNSGNIGTV